MYTDINTCVSFFCFQTSMGVSKKLYHVLHCTQLYYLSQNVSSATIVIALNAPTISPKVVKTAYGVMYCAFATSISVFWSYRTDKMVLKKGYNSRSLNLIDQNGFFGSMRFLLFFDNKKIVIKFSNFFCNVYHLKFFYVIVYK